MCQLPSGRLVEGIYSWSPRVRPGAILLDRKGPIASILLAEQHGVVWQECYFSLNAVLSDVRTLSGFADLAHFAETCLKDCCSRQRILQCNRALVGGSCMSLILKLGNA
jgi:hypothetical protein